MARRTALLALVALALLAGCAGTLPAADDPAYPPGVDESGVNETAVAEAHAAALDGSNHTLSMTVNNSMDGVGREISIVQRSDATGENVWFRMNASDADQTVYLTADEQYTRYAVGDRTRYAVSARPDDDAGATPVSDTGADLVDTTLSAGNFSVAGTEERDGRTVTTLTADALTDDADVPAEATGFEGTVVVDEDGVVRSLDYRLTFEEGDRRAATAVSLTVSEVGSTTVPAPDWRDEANESATDA